MSTIKVGVVVGSLRKAAYTGYVAKGFTAMLPAEFECKALNINLPLYNQDFDEGDTPPEYTTFRSQVAAMDAYLFVTPEYNRSMPPALKNALDIASRPMGSNAWGGKPGAIISATPGGQGAFGANHHLRQVLAFLDVYTMAQPEIYLAGVDKLLDASGNIANEGTKGFLQSCADAYAKWVGRFV